MMPNGMTLLVDSLFNPQCCCCTGQKQTAEGLWGIPPFFVECGPHPTPPSAAPFDFRAPTTASNALRVLRALQLKKAVLLEGSPGVGKTSLVAALASAIGQYHETNCSAV